MEYFRYEIKENKVTLVGTDRGQIINVLRSYNEQGNKRIIIPIEEEIQREKITINGTLPPINLDHIIDAEVKEDVILCVNERSFLHLNHLIHKYRESSTKFRRGDLYKFKLGKAGLTYILPKEIMDGITDHDWNQYKERIQSWSISPDSTEVKS